MRKSDLLLWRIGGTIPNGTTIAAAIRKAPLVAFFNVAPFSGFLSPSIYLARILKRNRIVIREHDGKHNQSTPKISHFLLAQVFELLAK